MVPQQRNLTDVLERAGAGATICFGSGTYRLTEPLMPLDEQTLVSTQPREAVLNGSVLFASDQIEQSGSFWVIGGQAQQGPVYDVDEHTNTCDPPEYEGCRYPEQVFLDNESLWQVTSLDELSTGEFFFDYPGDEVYIADNPAGKALEIGVAAAAVVPGGENITIDGLVVEKFNTPASGAALHTGTDWTVLDCEVRYNNGGGTFSADGSLIKDCYVHHNGQAGTFGDGTGAVLDGVEVAFNGINGYNTSWEGGGSKFVSTDGLVLRNCHYHDNEGVGIWFDIDNIDSLVEGCEVNNNMLDGILFEIGFEATVRNNVVTQNGWGERGFGAGIRASNNRDVEAYNNTVLDNAAGIIGVMFPPGEGEHGLRETANLFVHDNIIRVAEGGVAAGLELLEFYDEVYFSPTKGNRWQGNTYLFPASMAAFEWDDIEPRLSYLQWQSGTSTWMPMDATGSAE